MTVFWHGSPSGVPLRGGSHGLHVGSYEAAKHALGIRIGTPAQGEWDGTREYGKTLLAGRRRLIAMDRRGYLLRGYNGGAPSRDYYPNGKATYFDNTPVPRTVRPVLLKVRIVGTMSNTPDTPYSDNRANSMMHQQVKKGTARRGYYYINHTEDIGSVSAVVPDGSFLQIANSAGLGTKKTRYAVGRRGKTGKPEAVSIGKANQ